MEMWWRAAALDALQACCPVAVHLLGNCCHPNFVCPRLQTQAHPATGTAQLRKGKSVCIMTEKEVRGAVAHSRRPT